MYVLKIHSLFPFIINFAEDKQSKFNSHKQKISFLPNTNFTTMRYRLPLIEDTQ